MEGAGGGGGEGWVGGSVGAGGVGCGDGEGGLPDGEGSGDEAEAVVGEARCRGAGDDGVGPP